MCWSGYGAFHAWEVPFCVKKVLANTSLLGVFSLLKLDTLQVLRTRTWNAMTARGLVDTTSSRHTAMPLFLPLNTETPHEKSIFAWRSRFWQHPVAPHLGLTSCHPDDPDHHAERPFSGLQRSCNSTKCLLRFATLSKGLFEPLVEVFRTLLSTMFFLQTSSTFVRVECCGGSSMHMSSPCITCSLDHDACGNAVKSLDSERAFPVKRTVCSPILQHTSQQLIAQQHQRPLHRHHHRKHTSQHSLERFREGRYFVPV